MGLTSKANWLVSFPKQSRSSSEMICWPISQPNYSEYHHVKFLSQPCPLFLQKNHVMHSHLTSRLPSAYENVLCHFQNHLYNMSILNQLQLHTCNSTHQPSPNLAHLSNLHYHLQWLTNTILFHIIVSLC